MYHSYKFFTVIISVFVWTVKVFLAIMSTSGTVIPTDHHLHIYWWSDITHVLKSCLILVAWNSDFFGSVYDGWQPNWQPLTTHAFVGEKNAHACEVYFINYVTVSLFYFYYPSNIFQHTRKMFMNRLLFMVCQCSLKWFCEQKKHFPSIAMLFILNQIFNTEFSILDVRFENWEILFCHVICLDQLLTSK